MQVALEYSHPDTGNVRRTIDLLDEHRRMLVTHVDSGPLVFHRQLRVVFAELTAPGTDFKAKLGHRFVLRYEEVLSEF